MLHFALYLTCLFQFYSLLTAFIDVLLLCMKVTHKQYLKLSGDAERLRRKIEDLGVELDTWDKAREICLNIADEMF